MAAEAPLHIIELRAENVKRLQAVTVQPDGSVVVIGGQNAQGKTSLLDAIEMALGGAKTIPVEPVRRGARKARVVVDLGEIVVERTFSPKGTALEVRNAEGVPQKSPQALLDGLTSRVCFDPLAFAREEPAKQDAILKQVLGLDFTALDGRRAKLYADRRDLNRDAKALEARLDSTTRHVGIPDKEVSAAELMAELERLQDIAGENRNKRERLEMARDRVVEITEDREATGRLIRETEERLEMLRRDIDEKQAALEAARVEVDQQTEIVESIVEPDIEPIKKQIADADDVNRRVRENAQHQGLERQLKGIENDVEKLSEEIAAIDEEKAAQLGAAQFPVPGLGFDETGPTLNGIPLSQSSQAERLRVSVAIGAALNPRVRVMLVRDGSLLDDKSMQLLAELAAETGSQLWVEKVSSNPGECSVFIEDGMVVEDDAAASA